MAGKPAGQWGAAIYIANQALLVLVDVDPVFGEIN
jgi:hypothetical protein